MRRVAGAGLLLAVLVTALPGCTGGGSGSGGRHHLHPPATASPPASPAVAPPLAAPPDGVVAKVGDGAAGIAIDSATQRVAVAVHNPERLVLLDARTGMAVTQVPLPGPAAAVSVAGAGGPFLVPLAHRAELVRVTTDGVAKTVRLSTKPGGGLRGAVHLRDGGDLVSCGTSVAVLRGDRPLRQFGRFGQASAVVLLDDDLGVLDAGASNLSMFDVKSGREGRTVRAGSGATGMIADRHDRLIVADTRGAQLLLFGIDPLALRQRVPLDGAPFGMAYDAVRDELWVTLTARNEVVGFDLSGAQPKEVARWHTVRQPDSIAVDKDDGSVYVTGRTDGEVQTIRR
jgi:hypothetical protein